MEEKVMRTKDVNLIPPGLYCYIPLGGIMDPVLVCPYWSLCADKEYQNNGYCDYLKEGDWDTDELSLLWDQVKECGKNNRYEDSTKAKIWLQYMLDQGKVPADLIDQVKAQISDETL